MSHPLKSDRDSIRVLYFGDVVGNPGRLALQQLLPGPEGLQARLKADLVIANVENAASGSGLTPDLYGKFTAMGINGQTLGDHAFRKSGLQNTLRTALDLCRPANLATAAAGRPLMALDPDFRRRGAERAGVALSAAGRAAAGVHSGLPPVVVIPVLGRVFMNHLPPNDPFASVDHLLTQINATAPGAIVIVEAHAEATSEKIALAWHLNGRVAAVLGSHTHVPTRDARLLPASADEPVQHGGIAPSGADARTGTAAITDLGMCGPRSSILGRRVDRVLTQMTTSMPAAFEVALHDPVVAGVLLEIDVATRLCRSITPIDAEADVTRAPFA